MTRNKAFKQFGPTETMLKTSSIYLSLCWILLMSLSLHTAKSVAAEGMQSHRSPYDVDQTMARLEQTVRERGLNIFANIDHAAGAAGVGMELRPTRLLIFGNPQGGTPVMQCAQTMGIDLPLKVLVWEDSEGQTWLNYTSPRWLAQRHQVDSCPAVEQLESALQGLVDTLLAP